MTEQNNNQEYITLYDEEGNEALYEILMTIDGQEQFQKNYVLVYPAGVSEDEDVELYAYSFEEDEEVGNEGKLSPVETDEEWDMIEEVLQAFLLDSDSEEE